MSLFESDLTCRYPTPNGRDLLWRPDLGIGFLPSNGLTYEDDYWEKYQRYKFTELGQKLNDYRIEVVKLDLPEKALICDVGIGSGHFVETFAHHGFDVNPVAVGWLKRFGYFANPYVEKFDALTFWDVLEHIDNPTPLLKTDFVFVSLPIHTDVDACLRSKHLRPNEHLWHFTHEGFILYMRLHGYNLLRYDDGETRLGREDIVSYTFKRYK